MFAKLFFHEETRNISYPEKPLRQEMFAGQKRFMAGESYSLTDKLLSTKTALYILPYTYIHAIHKSACTVIKKIEAFLSLEGYLKLFAVFQNSQKFLCVRIYSTISRGTPNDVLQKHGWETPPYSEHMYLSAHPHTSVQLLPSFLPLTKLHKLFRPVSSTDILYAFT